MDEISDAVLYRNIYTNILSQQIHAENRLHRLMLARQGKDASFDDHLATVRAKVEKDRNRIKKLGESLLLVERKDAGSTVNGNMKSTKGSKPAGFVTLLNIKNLRNQFRLDQNNAPNERRKDQKHNNSGNTFDQNVVQSAVDPKDIEFFFENPFTLNQRDCPPSTLNTTHIDKQEVSRKFDRFKDYPLATSQGLKDGLPKRVSFKKHSLVSHEGWDSDYSDDEADGNAERNPFMKTSGSRYTEPPLEFNLSSYQDHIERNTQKSSFGEARICNQNLDRKVECQDNGPKPSSKSQKPLKNCEEHWGLANDHGNSPFKSPWEGVISTSLQREQNDSTQVVPSSTTNNEVFLDDLSASKTLESSKNSFKAAPDTCKSKEEIVTTTEDPFRMEKTGHKRFEEFKKQWLNLDKDTELKQEEINKNNEIYEHIVDNKRDTKFIQDSALRALRKQSWYLHPPDTTLQRKVWKRLVFIFRRHTKNTSQVIKADKKEFHVNKKVRRQMSLRPLPETPDIIEENTHAQRLDTADSLDTFQHN